MSFNFSSNENIQKLIQVTSELSDLGGIASLLNWDQETYMPPKGAQARAKQISLISGLYHQKLTDKTNGKLLRSLKKEISESPNSFTLYDKAMVREFKRSYEKATKLPTEFVREQSEQVSLALEAWKEAREKSDFSIFEPALSKVLDLALREAEYYGYKEYAYDALLDLYEPGLTQSRVEKIFEPLKKFTVEYLKKIQDSGREIDTSILDQKFEVNKQWDLSMELAKALGYDFEAGRLDKSAHPFTSGFSLKDVRITTRMKEEELWEGISSTVHETGHALYEQGISSDLSRTVLEGTNSLGIHESQSRMWENLVGKSPEFWEYWFKKLVEYFPDQLKIEDKEAFVKAINKVQPSLIRVGADELTYNLHIIIRFEIEKDLLSKKIKVKDLPEIWNSKMKEYLGITPPTNALGVLQDIHWSHGSFGYFPTYTLGNIYAAQFWEKIQQDLPHLNEEIGDGKYDSLLKWLRENIHQYGSIYSADELSRRITGKSIDSKPLIKYFKNKFDKIYF